MHLDKYLPVICLNGPTALYCRRSLLIVLFLLIQQFNIIEFDGDTFRILLTYLHTGSCPLSCVTIPGLICAAEHYDLPELLQACFHHAKQFIRVDVVRNKHMQLKGTYVCIVSVYLQCCQMLGSLENYYWRYTSASELVNMILAFIETRALAVFHDVHFLDLSESMVQMIMNRNLEVSELAKYVLHCIT